MLKGAAVRANALSVQHSQSGLWRPDAITGLRPPDRSVSVNRKSRDRFDHPGADTFSELVTLEFDGNPAFAGRRVKVGRLLQITLTAFGPSNRYAALPNKPYCFAKRRQGRSTSLEELSRHFRT